MTSQPILTHVLRTIEGFTPERVFPLDRKVTTIGFDPGCDMVLNQNTVSKRHARIVRESDGYYLEDLDSHNGTYLDGKKLTERARLRDGQQIWICSFHFCFSRPTVEVQEPDEDSSTVLGLCDSSSSFAQQQSAVRPEEKLRALVEINRALVGAIKLDEVLGKVLEALFRIFPQAERGFVLLKERADERLVTAAVKVRRDPPGQLSVSRTIVDHIMKQGKAVLSEDARRDFGEVQSIVKLQIHTVMGVPIWDQDQRPAGLIQLDARDRRGKFSAEDLDLLAAVAGQISVAVENARLHANEVERIALEQEMRHARAVQRALLPAHRPLLAGYEFWDCYEPARYVGGDYFDYVPLAAPESPSSRWAIALGDVMGKGMPAALLMARLSSEVRLLLQSEPDPARVVARLNQELCETGTAERFITFILVVLDGARHELTVVNAGHMGPLVRRAGGQIEVVGQDLASPFLTLDAQNYQAVTSPIEPGDVVVLYTDGVTEAKNQFGKMFKMDGLQHALAAAPPNACAVGEAILEAVHRHAAECEQYDDIALVCFGRA